MKVNLLLNSTDVRSGWLNIDPLASASSPGITIGDPGNLDEWVDDAEATEIVALDIIDYLSSPVLSDVVDHWIKKLRHGGLLTIGGIDMREVAKRYIEQQIDLMTANSFLYGDQSAPWQYRKATLTLQHVINVLQSHGLEIQRKQVKEFRYCVTAKRP